MPKPKKWKISALDRREEVGIGELQRRIKQARREVAVIVANSARDRKLVISGRNREALYNKIGSVYAQLDLGLKDWGKDLIQKTAIDWHDAAIKDVREQTQIDPSNKVTKFSREYAEDVFKRVHPENGRSLAAVLTDRMAQEDIKALRGAVTDVFREGSLTGKTMAEMASGIKGRWDGIAGNLTADRFIDNAGRAWEDGRYLQMLVRTTVARVSRDSYFDTLTRNGDDLAIIQNVDGEACDICMAWDGVIISITGTDDKYPTYNDALNAGWGHPNCRCVAERVDETIDKDAIKQQAATETPDFERQDGETNTEYRNRVTDAVADYSKRFGGDLDIIDNVESIGVNTSMEFTPIVSRNIPEDIRDAVIAETEKVVAEDKTGLDYGFRMLPEDMDKVSVGEPLKQSFEWNADGENTGTPLGGVSVTGIRNKDHVERAMKDFTSQGYYGRTMALVRGASNGSGQDIGEKLLAEAEIVRLWVVGKKK